MFFEILNKYGAIKDNRASYDEKVLGLYKRYNIPPIEIKLDYVDNILKEFLDSDKSLIVTGSAGDGKTFILRKLFEKLGGDNKEFKSICKINNITFILDFTAIENKKEIILEAKNKKYIIAMNEGLLNEYVNKDEFLIKDLSKTSSANNFDLLLDKVLEYIDKYETKNECIIFKNIELLKEVRGKIRDIILMNDFNYEHITIRRLFVFISNLILGSKNQNLLKSCKDISFLESNLYSNIFGENLSASMREKKPFEFLNRLSIGYKSNNEIDNLILYSKDERFKNIYFDVEEFFRKRDSFLDNGDYNLIKDYVVFLRRDLFFRHKQNSLMRYISFEAFKTLFDDLKDNKPVSKRIKKLIALALNRIFLGALINEKDNLYIGSSFKGSNKKIANEIIEKLDIKEINFEFIKGNDEYYGEIYLVIKNKKMLLDLDIFEFLVRIANGSLVNSFSNEFLERVMIFKSHLIDENEELILFDIDENGKIELTEFELGDNYVRLQ